MSTILSWVSLTDFRTEVLAWKSCLMWPRASLLVLSKNSIRNCMTSGMVDNMLTRSNIVVDTGRIISANSVWLEMMCSRRPMILLFLNMMLCLKMSQTFFPVSHRDSASSLAASYTFSICSSAHVINVCCF